MQLLGEKFFLKYLCIIVILSFLLVETLSSFFILMFPTSILTPHIGFDLLGGFGGTVSVL